MDIKHDMAETLADSLGARLERERCDKCRYPLMMIPAQGMPFCGLCTTKRIYASDARSLMLRVRMLEKGVIIPKESAARAANPILFEP